MGNQEMYLKITISQPVTIVGDRFPHFWHKDYENDVIPHKGDFIQDTLWDGDEYYEVKEVIIQYKLNECYIEIEKYKHDISDDKKEDLARMTGYHEWKCSWDFSK